MSGVDLQDTFFEQAKNNNYVVMVHLIGKVKLVGTIKDYDKYSVTINSYGQDQLIYKQAIATIVLPRGRSIRLMLPKTEGADRGRGEGREAGPPRERRPFRDGPPRGPRPGGPSGPGRPEGFKPRFNKDPKDRY
jgi:host factor-I protein